MFVAFPAIARASMSSLPSMVSVLADAVYVKSVSLLLSFNVTVVKVPSTIAEVSLVKPVKSKAV